MKKNNCPETLDGQHSMDWFEVPESIHYGDFGASVTPGYQRGICMACGEQATRV